ncbi:hypothetical protein D3C85_1627290 [compost metagenome]
MEHHRRTAVDQQAVEQLPQFAGEGMGELAVGDQHGLSGALRRRVVDQCPSHGGVAGAQILGNVQVQGAGRGCRRPAGRNLLPFMVAAQVADQADAQGFDDGQVRVG